MTALLPLRLPEFFNTETQQIFPSSYSQKWLRHLAEITHFRTNIQLGRTTSNWEVSQNRKHWATCLTNSATGSICYFVQEMYASSCKKTKRIMVVPFPPTPKNLWANSDKYNIWLIGSQRDIIHYSSTIIDFPWKAVLKKEFEISVISGTCKKVYTPYSNTTGLNVILLMNVESSPEVIDTRDNGCRYGGVMLGERHFGESGQIYL